MLIGRIPPSNGMYFSVEVDQQFHLWRQRFPDGRPEQLTFGPTEEEGSRWLLTDRSSRRSGCNRARSGCADSRGERPLSSEGQITGPGGFSGLYWLPRFSPDGRSLTYLRRESTASSAELWRTDIASGQSERLLPGVGMRGYRLQSRRDRGRLHGAAAGKGRNLDAPLDRSAPPRAIASSCENSPQFGPAEEILFRSPMGRSTILAG